MYSLGAKLSVVCAGPCQPPNCLRRCHLPVVVGVLLETNLGIFTEGNLLLSTSQPSTLGNQGGARSHHASTTAASATTSANHAARRASSNYAATTLGRHILKKAKENMREEQIPNSGK